MFSCIVTVLYTIFSFFPRIYVYSHRTTKQKHFFSFIQFRSLILLLSKLPWNFSVQISTNRCFENVARNSKEMNCLKFYLEIFKSLFDLLSMIFIGDLSAFPKHWHSKCAFLMAACDKISLIIEVWLKFPGSSSSN